MFELEERDRALVRQMLAGDEAAFDRFFDTYAPRLYRFAVARLRSDEAAEEVVQATLSRVMAKLATYRGEAALFTWLCTFCRHEISAYYRLHQRTASEVTLSEDEPDVRAALESLSASGGGGPEENLQRIELARLVRTTLDYLPERYGDALEWKYIQDLPVREIARRLAVSPKAAESVLSRAREAFREAFDASRGGAEAWQR